LEALSRRQVPRLRKAALAALPTLRGRAARDAAARATPEAADMRALPEAPEAADMRALPGAQDTRVPPEQVDTRAPPALPGRAARRLLEAAALADPASLVSLGIEFSVRGPGVQVANCAKVCQPLTSTSPLSFALCLWRASC